MTDDPHSPGPERGGPSSDQPRSGALIHRLRGFLGLRAEASVRDTLDALIDDRDDAEIPIDRDERALLKNILALRDLTVDDVMVPRAHIVAVEVSASFDEVVALLCDAAHSRLPVYRETLDDVLGMIHIKDVLAASRRPQAPTLEELMRPILYVPSSMPAFHLLVEMRAKRTHLGVVVDEYGGTDGLVTIEDVVEEIVGDIEDEHDPIEQPTIERFADGTLLVDAGTPLEELTALTGSTLETDEVDTLGGLVTALAGRVPDKGETFTHASGLVFEVVAADPRRVATVRVRNLPAVDAALSA